MPIREIAEIPRPDGVVRLTEEPGLRGAVRADDIRCSFMSLTRRGGGASAGSKSDPVCDRLRLLFDEVAEEPVPDHLTSLAERLDQALASGELSRRKGKTTGR
jgi:hypothetical protein